jgi:hypothetical protein
MIKKAWNVTAITSEAVDCCLKAHRGFPYARNNNACEGQHSRQGGDEMGAARKLPPLFLPLFPVLLLPLLLPAEDELLLPLPPELLPQSMSHVNSSPCSASPALM